MTNGLPRLQDLNLAGNLLGDAGVLALAAGFGSRALPALTTLALGRNAIGDAGAAALAAALGRGALPSQQPRWQQSAGLRFRQQRSRGAPATLHGARRAPEARRGSF